MSRKKPNSTAAPADGPSPAPGPGSRRSRKQPPKKGAKRSAVKSVPGVVATGSKTQPNAKKQRKKTDATTAPRVETSKAPPIENSKAAKPETSEAGFRILNTTALASLFDCDRAVIAKYVRKHKIKPFREREKLKEYELTPELESVLEEEIGSPKLSDVRLEDAEITRDIKRVNLEKSRGRLVDFTDACEYFGVLMKGLYLRIDGQYAPAAGPRLHKLKTAKEVTSALRRDLRKILGEFRADPGRFAK